MKKIIGVSLIVLMVLLAACSTQNTGTETTNLLEANWDSVLEEAKGQTVNIHMWGGSETINNYMDSFVAPNLKEQFDVELNRVPITDAKDMINKLLTEKEVNKEEGTIDIFWINGENFKRSKDNDLLWGSFAGALPNYQNYIDGEAEDMLFDFGEPVEGYEVPWGKAQFVMIYDSARVENPPKSMDELMKWAEENPGKFTYPAPPDFTGSAFIRHGLYETTGGYQQYLENMDMEKFNTQSESLYSYLNELKPNLWRNGETYPESTAKLDQLFANGEVDFTMNYNSVHASNMIKAGQFPDTARSFVFDQGTLSNTHYLSIPYNASHKAGAMVVVNYLVSPQAQIAKLDPTYWGDETVLDVNKLTYADRQAMEAIDLGQATLPRTELSTHRVPEIKADYVNELENGWYDKVAKD